MNTLEKKTKISINIWDDFYEDGFVPKGEIQETYAYIESEIKLNRQKDHLDNLLCYMNKNLNTAGVKMSLELYEPRNKYPNLVGTENELLLIDRWQITIQGLTHDRLSEWMRKMDSEVEIEGYLFEVYSES